MKGRTSTPTTWFGNTLPNWNTVTGPNGHVGTSERTDGITKNYNASGNLHSITDSKGVTRDLSGNPVSDPYGE